VRKFLLTAVIFLAVLVTGCEQPAATKAPAKPVARPFVPTTQAASTHASVKDADSKAGVADCCAVDAAPSTQPANASTVAPPAPAPVVVAPTTKPAAAPSRVSPWIEPDKRVALSMDYEMTDQDGKTVSLSRYLGKPGVVSFFFTRCSNPQMCPLVTFTMANLQRDLAAAGIDGKVNCALISYDPIFDTPERVKAFGTERGFNFKQGAMLSPAPAQFRDFVLDWELAFNVGADGQINHKLEAMVIDKQGRFVREYHGEIWKNADVVKDLERLLAEP
jgi:cytochrome oxidase Cu insertion factor (SCO1/SenC/PrrC family)